MTRPLGMLATAASLTLSSALLAQGATTRSAPMARTASIFAFPAMAVTVAPRHLAS